MKDTVIIYHSPCLDGFGGAYAAWKKFGDTATYLPMRRSKLQTDGFAGKDVYFIDFTYPQELTDKITKEAKSVTILDHHMGVKDVVESVPNHVFDNNRSGATIAWSYFHPNAPLPHMFTYIEDNDLWRNSLPNWREVSSYLSVQPFDFKTWGGLIAQFEDPKEFGDVIKVGGYFNQYAAAMIDQTVEDAFLVEFEGHQIMAVNAPGSLRSAIGNRLAKMHPPFALTWHVEPAKAHYSLRGNGDVNLAELAQKYGGNGHHDAAGFHLPPDAPPPFKRL